MKILQLIESGRQTGQTTTLIKLIRDNNGLLIFGDSHQIPFWLKRYPELKNKIYTLYDVRNGKLDGTKSGQPIYFDNTAVAAMSVDWDKKFETPDIIVDSAKKQQANFMPSEEDLKEWRETFSVAAGDRGFSITSDGEIIITNQPSFATQPKEHQINIKLTKEDLNEIENINKDFFEGEASNSMLGRVILRKGIAFYQKLKSLL